VRSGTAAYITTGAKLPPGANAVVKVEDTEEGELGPNGKEATVKILRRVTNGTFVRTTGSDIAEGQLVVPRGTFVHAAEVGLLATVGVVEVPVYRKPIVGVMSTGDELLEASSTSLVGSKIRDSNRPSLLAALREQGFEVLDAGIVVDLSSMLRSCIIDALAR
jgi:gephyrin